MNNYWPHRANPEGFSIKKLAKRARERISKVSGEANKKATERPYGPLNGANSIEAAKEIGNKSPLPPEPTPHWANRNFEEYRKAA